MRVNLRELDEKIGVRLEDKMNIMVDAQISTEQRLVTSDERFIEFEKRTARSEQRSTSFEVRTDKTLKYLLEIVRELRS